MRFVLSIAVIVVILLIAGLSLGYLHVSQVQQASLPRVTVSGGQAPKFSVDTAKVDVGTEQRTVDVPRIDSEKKAVEVPTVSVRKPGA